MVIWPAWITLLAWFSFHSGDDEEETQHYGAIATRFQYDKAPPRGWQEDKRDLSHRDIYIKYNDDGREQKYAV